MRAFALVAVLVLAAGCAQQAQPFSANLEGTAAVDPAEAAPTLASVQHGNVAEVRFHEEIDPKLADFEPTRAVETLPPRDVSVNFTGVHNVLDAYARPVPAYAFQYDARLLYVEQDNRGHFTSAHYETTPVEYDFAAADGHFVGATNLATGTRSFEQPQVTAVQIGLQALSFMLPLATGGDLTQEHAIFTYDNHTYYLHYEISTERPLPGDCQPYESRLRVDPPLPPPARAPKPKPVKPEDQMHDLLCVQPGQLVPLWAYDGSVSKGSIRTTRLGESFRLPALSGTPLAKVEYNLHEWDAYRSAIPGQQPVLTAPSSAPGDWGNLIAQRLPALEQDPAFQSFRAQATQPIPVDLASLGLDLNLFPSSSVPVGFNFDSFLSLAQPNDWYGALVYRAELPMSQSPFMAQPHQPALANGFGFGNALAPKIPAAGDVQTQLAPVLPKDGIISFFLVTFPDFGPVGFWVVLTPCGSDGGGFAFIDAMQGFVEAAGTFAPGSPACGAMAAKLQPHAPANPAETLFSPSAWQKGGLAFS